MANPLIGEVAMWEALKAFCVAASVTPANPGGITADKVYRARQNAPEVVGSPASVRLWSDTGAVAASTNWQTQRTKLAEVWRVRVIAALVGGDYAGEVLDTLFGYTGQVGDTKTIARDALLADLPATVNGAVISADTFSITGQIAGVPLGLEVGPAELLAATRTRKTASELRWCPGEIIVQIEVVSERPRDRPTDVPSAMSFLDTILGKFAHDLGPTTDLERAGLGFRRFAMQPTDLTALDRAGVRSRARADIVFSVDVADTLEFDRVAAIEPPTGEATA